MFNSYAKYKDVDCSVHSVLEISGNSSIPGLLKLQYLVTVSLGGTLVAYILRANGVRAVLVSADSDSAQC